MKKVIWSLGDSDTNIVSNVNHHKRTGFIRPNRTDEQEIEIYGGFLVCSSVNNLDNAYLISAAPELLECLEDVVDNFSPYISNTCLDRYQDVIMKAKGITQVNFETIQDRALDALMAAKAVFDAQGIDVNHKFCGEQYEKVISTIQALKEEIGDE